MISSEIIISLLEAVKTNDIQKVDQIIKKIISEAERRNYHQVSKKLRQIYATPYSLSSDSSNKPSKISNSSFHSSGISNTKNMNLFELRDSKVNLENIILSKSNLKKALEIVKTYKNRDKLTEIDIQYENNLFLYGQPGTGKTLLAYALAGELDIPVLHVYLDSLISSYLGETGKNIAKIFQQANTTPCVIFLDEFDAIGKMRDDSRDLGELKRVVTVLLQKIDELSNESILVSATNHDHLIDKAIRRRFNYEMHLDLLDKYGRKKLIDLYLHKFGNFETDLLADISEGLSGSYIRQIINRTVKNWYLGDRKKDLFNILIKNFSETYFSLNNLNTKDEDKRLMLSKILSLFRNYDSKKYTYKKLEEMTGIPDSTLHNIVSEYANK